MALMQEMYTKPGMNVPMKDILDMMVSCRGENIITVETMAGALVIGLPFRPDIRLRRFQFASCFCGIVLHGALGDYRAQK